MLYFAPINLFGNFVFRHLVLFCGADFVFSELILIKDVDFAIKNDKLKIIKEDIPKTVFQIGVSNTDEVKRGINFLKETIPNIVEININMGCPQSSMQQNKLCGGLLHDPKLMGKLAKELSSHKDFTPSVKLRLGTSQENIKIEEYIKILSENGVKKVYVHSRPLRYGYNKPCLHNELKDLKEKFPHTKLIFNGDVDSYESYLKLNHDDVMIGRAALSNPFVFEDIKNKKFYENDIRKTDYNPILKDPYVLRTDSIKLSPKKIVLIKDFINLAKKYHLRNRLFEKNLYYLLKGITDKEVLIKKVRKIKSYEDLNLEFDNWLNEFS